MPARKTRGAPVDYQALDGADSDDDFNVSTPPTKRPRAQKASERAAEFADGAGPSNGRPSLDDKLFKKQLKIALEKSQCDSQASDASSQELSIKSADTVHVSQDASYQEHSIKSADTVPVSQDDELDSPKTGARSEDTVSQDSAGNQDEWAAGGASSSDESEESGDDSSYSEEEFKPKAKKAVKKPAKSNATKPPTPKTKPAKPALGRRPVPAKSVGPAGTRSVPSGPPVLTAMTSVTRSPAGSPAGGPPPLSRPVLKAVNSVTRSPKGGPAGAPSVFSPPVKAVKSATETPSGSPAAPALSAGRSTPKWRPPARASETGASDNRLLSPSGGGLRLGLSRNVRLKPLHPSARPVT